MSHVNPSWFYFIPSAEQLVDELRDDYLSQTRELWGTSTDFGA
jgi:hypothetical protein